MGVGLWLRIAYEGYATLLPQYAILSADSLAIAVGTIAFSLSLCACCGSWFQNRCLLITVTILYFTGLKINNNYYVFFLQYFCLVVFMFLVEFLVGSLAFVFRKDLGHRLTIELQDGLLHHYNITAKGPNSLVTIWDHLQTEVIKRNSTYIPHQLLRFPSSFVAAASRVTSTGTKSTTGQMTISSRIPAAGI